MQRIIIPGIITAFSLLLSSCMFPALGDRPEPLDTQIASRYDANCQDKQYKYCSYLGSNYSRNIEEKPALSIRYHKQACEQGITFSCWELASNRSLVEHKSHRSNVAFYLQKSCNLGLNKACWRIETEDYPRPGTKENIKEQLHFLKRLCDQPASYISDRACEDFLGNLHYYGVKEFSDNYILPLSYRICLEDSEFLETACKLYEEVQKKKNANFSLQAHLLSLCEAGNLRECNLLALTYFGQYRPKPGKEKVIDALFHKACRGGFLDACKNWTLYARNALTLNTTSRSEVNKIACDSGYLKSCIGYGYNLLLSASKNEASEQKAISLWEKMCDGEKYTEGCVTLIRYFSKQPKTPKTIVQIHQYQEKFCRVHKDNYLSWQGRELPEPKIGGPSCKKLGFH